VERELAENEACGYGIYMDTLFVSLNTFRLEHYHVKPNTMGSFDGLFLLLYLLLCRNQNDCGAQVWS